MSSLASIFLIIANVGLLMVNVLHLVEAVWEDCKPAIVLSVIAIIANIFCIVILI